jgi:mannose-6-phosphate isomerase-like protein (cupin superfamily)
MKGYYGNIEQLTVSNENFRQVLYTGPHSQLVLMTLKPMEEIGEEIHVVDQFFRFEQGTGKSIVDGNEYEVKEGDAIVVPAGAKHNIINTSDSEPLKLYTIYSPANHKDGTTAMTKEEALAHEEHFDGKTTE